MSWMVKRDGDGWKHELMPVSSRRLLDAELAEQIEAPHAADMTGHEEVISAMMALLARDGLSQ